MSPSPSVNETAVDGTSPEASCAALAQRYDLPVFEGNLLECALPAPLAEIGRGFFLDAGLYPYEFEDGGPLKVVVADPAAYGQVDQLGTWLDCEVEVQVAPANTIREAINVAFLAASQRDDASLEHEQDDAPISMETDLLDAGDEAPVVRTLNRILSHALQSKCSDIHIEPGEKDVIVRYRIDGILEDGPHFPKVLLPSLVSRVKIMSNLDITERRRDQDGRIKVTLADRPVDIRVSIVPATFGERVVLRILEREKVLLGLNEVGLGDDHLHQLRDFLAKSNGLVLVTGPTGSGKTTTLYGALSSIDTSHRNVITLEDPVEYQIPGISQIQVNPKVDLTFARGLRSVLRQDPDVIMVGEIRDRETAEMALQASLTGHLVLSTLHTNDAPSAVARLCDMDIEPFLLSTSLLGVCAQRLVRRLCDHCKRPAEVLPTLPNGMASPRKAWEAVGCDACRGAGYLGREGIFEMFRVTEHVRHGIMAMENGSSLAERARKDGFRTMFEHGVAKVEQGLTTLEEVIRVARAETA